MRHKIKGIVLREAPKGETSKLLTVLASDLGVITVNAKGVRKLSSAYLKSAQQFAFSDMLLYEKNGFYTLTEAALIAEFYPVREDIKSYALACYLCEAASAFAVPGEEANNVLRLLLNSLYALENGISTHSVIKSAFELRLCAECGFMPETEFCDICGDEILNNLSLFHLSDGVVHCKGCASGSLGYAQITPAVSKAIAHITRSDMSRFLSFRISENDQAVLSDTAERFLLIRAERGFKTLSFYKHCEELP